MNKKKLGVFILIILLATALRLYHILLVPPHLYWDEVSIAYNAYSINLTGRDEWGVNYPLLFKSFGDNKLPLYVYLVALFQRIMGPNDLSVRLPSAFAGIGTVFIIYFLVREQAFLIKEKYKKFLWVNNPTALALVATLFLAISPWHLQFSRPGFEANVALFFQTLGSFLFLVAMRRNLKLLYLAIPCFVATMYTYHSATITSPLILGILMVLFYKKLLANRQVLFKAIVLGFILILPYLPTYLFSAEGRIRFSSESVSNMPGNVVVNFVDNYVSNFSTDFLFFKGDQNGRHSVKTIGELYLWQLPTILAGIYFLLRYRSKATMIILSWVLFAALPPALTRVSPHALRDLLAVRSWQTISAIGLLFLLFKLPKFVRWIFLAIVLYAFFLYLNLYYIRYPNVFALDWQDGQRQTMTYLTKIQNQYDRILTTNDLYPIYVLWYGKHDPRVLFQSNHDLTKLGKFEYVNLTGIVPKKNVSEKDLMVVPSWMGVHPTDRPLQEIKMTNDQPVFRIYEY